MAKKQKSVWPVIIGVLIFLFIIAYIFAGMFSILLGPKEKTGNVAVIPVSGMILTESSQELFSPGIAASSSIVEKIEQAEKNPMVKAIILEINSPGGAPVATDEIAQAVKRTNKTTVAWIREVAASGAYWIASSADHVVANRMSITGSIGVYGSYLDFSGFIRDWNVTYQRLVAGKYKDTGIPFRELTDDEERLLQRKIDMLHQEFKDAVQKNRGLTNSEIEAVANGEFFLGSEAYDLNLVDELGGKNEAVAYIEDKEDIKANLVIYEEKESLLSMLAGVINDRSYYLGKGIGESIDPRVGMLR